MDESEQHVPPATVRWDTDSIPIRVDNFCTRSISFDVADFDPHTLQDAPDHLVVSGFVSKSNTPITKIGTIVWEIVDDARNPQLITIPNSYLVPGGSSRLLSPQHWAQEAKDHFPEPTHGTTCMTTGDTIVLQWNQAKYRKTINLDPHGNNVRYHMDVSRIPEGRNHCKLRPLTLRTRMLRHRSSESRDSRPI
jgi:hypothetical protein